MANEKVNNVTQSPDLKREVKFRRRKFEITDESTGETVAGEYIECTMRVMGEEIRFKVDKKDSKLLRACMRMRGYPLYDLDGQTVIPEERYEEDF